MRRFYQAVVEIIRGGVHPREVALAVALGLLAGFVSGWNLTLGVVLLAVVILNVPTKVFSEAWALGWAVSWSLTPASFTLGRWLLDESPLGSMLAPWRDHPLLTLFDWDRYTVLGGGAMALMMMLPAAWLAACITGLLQTKFQDLQKALESKTEWHGGLLVRLGCWVIFGDASQPALVPAVNPAWIRRRGLMLALGVFLPTGVLACYLAPGIVAERLLTALSTANQSEVNAGQVRLSFSDGLLEMEELGISDPDHPDRDRVRIGYVAAQLHPGPLLRGRVHVDRLMLENLETDVARHSRARPFGVRLPELDGGSLRDLIRDVDVSAPDSIDLEQCVAHWDELRDRLRKLEDLLTKINQLSGPAEESEDEYDPAQNAPASYRTMRQARHGFGRTSPKIWIELAAIKGLSSKFGLGSQASIELANVSNQPVLTGQPTIVALKAPEHGSELVATLNLHSPDVSHDLKFHATGIELTELISPRSRMPLALRRGTLSLVGRGSIQDGEFELALNAQLADLQVQVNGTRPLAGLPPQLWNDGLAQLQELQTEATLHGRISSPKLRVDFNQLAQSFQQQLLAGGQAALARAVQEQLTRGVATVERAIDQSLVQAEAAVDRQAAKVDAVVDRSTARAEQSLADAAGKAEGVVSQGEAQVAEVQQRLDQNAASVQGTLDRTASRATQTLDRYGRSTAPAQQTAQQWQNQIGAAGRFLQENVAAGALTAPVPAPAQGAPAELTALPAATESRDISATEPRRRGPPTLSYGDIVGSAGVEQPPATVESQTPAAFPTQPAPPVGASSESLRYPDSVRNYAEGSVPSASLPTESPTVMTPLPATADPRVAMESNPASRPASFSGPPPSMELGYEERRPALQQPLANQVKTEGAADRRASGFPSTPVVSGPVNRDAQTAPTARPPAAPPKLEEAPVDAPPDKPSVGARIGNWSRGVTGKVKGMVPWPRRSAEATASDEAISPEGQSAPAVETAAAPQLESAPTETPWYRRFWR